MKSHDFSHSLSLLQCGKSTLLRLIVGSLVPSSGEVLRGSNLRVGLYHQHFDDLLPYHLNPIEYLKSQYDIPTQEARKYLGNPHCLIVIFLSYHPSLGSYLLGMFGLEGVHHHVGISSLSGGQKARVVFASISLMRPHLLILDEPTNHLDMESVQALIQGINSFPGGVVLVCHDSRLICETRCQLWVCGRNEKCRSGLREDKRGFQRYKCDVLEETRREQERIIRRVEEQAIRKRALRGSRLSRRTLK